MVSCRRSPAVLTGEEVLLLTSTGAHDPIFALRSLCPHSEQNFALDGLSVPQVAQPTEMAAPQSEQTLAPAGLGVAQDEQAMARAAPHARQTLLSLSFVAPQLEHCMGRPLAAARGQEI